MSLGAGFTLAQETRFYIPKEIRQAYEKGTRSMDGNPGPNYWHNTADYKIEVSVDPATRLISGSEEVTFFNNSPDDLNTLVVRLYYDVFRKANARASRVNEQDIGEGTELSNIQVNGTPLQIDGRIVRKSGTNLIIRLMQPLKSGTSLKFSTDWKQYVPLSNRRTGARDSTSFFVAYWYPQIAVYDDVFGWDTFSYNLRTEFYNNLGNFDVKITVPEEFTVWSTGVLQNPDEVFTDATLQKYNEAHKSTETVGIITNEDITAGFKHKGGTWHYVADEVPDFAFGMSDHYGWDAAVQRVEDRDVFISTAFPSAEEEAYAQVTEIQRKTMKHFSEDIPGVPYPYPEFSTFIGLFGGGMEYPMMANNDGPGRGVTIHELFHTYFPMYVRVNERRFAWMDEGWATYNTTVVVDRFFEENTNPPFAGNSGGMSGTIGTISDLPLIVSSQFMDGTNYGYASYPLPGFVYGVLHQHLGDELFLKAYREYINRWAKKSPTPYDFIYTFENVTGQDLNWLWEPWFFSFGDTEVGIKELDGKNLVVKNSGSRPVPLDVRINYEDGTRKSIVKSASIWKDTNEYTVTIDNPKKVERIMVNMDVPDLEVSDNIYPSLKEIYKSAKIADDVEGTYQLNEFPVTANVTMKEHGLEFSIPGSYTTFLIPVSATEFESLDGQAKFSFQKEEGKCVGMNFQGFGMKLTSSKIQ